MNTKLQELANMIPLIKEFTNVDALVCIWDSDGRVVEHFDMPGVPIHFEPGEQLPDKSDPLYKVLQTGKPIYNKVPKEVFGTAIEGTITPIRENGVVVGAITYCTTSEDKEEIIKDTDELTTSIAQTDESIEGIVNSSQKLAENMSYVHEITEQVRTQVQEASKIVDSIQSNAKYSNILALNASIESARAGQAGQGFAVVSSEMRKFSKMSGESATKINNNLMEIEKSLNEVTDKVNTSTEVAQEQAVMANQLTIIFSGVAEKAQKVNNICKKDIRC